jgi:mannose-1-phosphate guanylyltransferase/mannose-6-phosphate isomerase
VTGRIVPVILCGGSGTRLWPLSRKSYPKQFVPLTGPRTLFQQAALRLSGPGFAAPVIVTASDFRFIVTDELSEAHVTPGTILIEPEAKNTAPAILAATLHIADTDPDALILVAPSDHAIPDDAAFRAAVAAARPAAESGRIITFGITPTRAETGYGWLEVDRASNDRGAHPLLAFVEKPGPDHAAAMFDSGRFLWNAGIFLFSARTLLATAAATAPDLLPQIRAALAAARPDLGFLRLDAAAWSGLPAISIDYAVMERATNLAVVPFTADWSDLGDWMAVWRATDRDDRQNATHGSVTAIDCSGSLLRSEADGLRLVGIGLTDVVAVAMPDAVLIADRTRAQEVKAAVARMKAAGARQAETFPRDHRPWGWFETIAAGARFQVKRIHVHPGAALSLQSHLHRAEHWIVVSGTARVTIGAETRIIAENESVYIPLNARHRLENPGKVPMVLIEVQTGSYLGEDDITRYDDAYARGPGAKG